MSRISRRSALIVDMAKETPEKNSDEEISDLTDSDDSEEDPHYVPSDNALSPLSKKGKDTQHFEKNFLRLLKEKQALSKKERNESSSRASSSDSESDDDVPLVRFRGLERKRSVSPALKFIDDNLELPSENDSDIPSNCSSPGSVWACLISDDDTQSDSVVRTHKKDDGSRKCDSEEPINKSIQHEELAEKNTEQLQNGNETNQRPQVSHKSECEVELQNRNEAKQLPQVSHKSECETEPFEKNLDAHMADSGTLPFSVPEFLASEVNKSKRDQRIWDKRDLCLYCFEDVTNFSRHLIRKHSSELAVQQLINMKKGSVERKNFIDILRKKGNFLAPSMKEIKLVKRSSKDVRPQNVLACEYCKGYYMKRYLKRHVRKCKLRPDDVSDDDNLNPHAQTYLAFRTLEADFAKSVRLKDGVSKMRCDEIALIAKSDPLILSFGSFYAKRHKHSHLDKVTRNKLREFARLWINMKTYIKEKSLFEALKPENFKYFVLSVKNISGYNDKTQEFKNAPSLALHMGTNLMQLCEHAFSEIQQKNKMFTTNIDPVKKAKEIKVLRRLLKKNWNAEISSVANQNVMENQWKKPTIIPLTSDIQVLNNYTKELANDCAEKLKKNGEDRKAFNDLQKCCYTLLIALNRRRIGELERLLLDSYLQESNNLISEEFTKNLTEAEMLLMNTYKRILIRGKRHKPVPVLISKEVQEHIGLLLSVRKNFVSERNPYLFVTVNKETSMDGYSTLRNFAIRSGAKHPEALTSGKLRKHIATISQVYNLDSSQMEQLCSFLGHSVATHQNFYRLPQEVYQTAKLASYLLKSQNGTVDSNNDDHLEEELQTDEEDECDLQISSNNTSDKTENSEGERDSGVVPTCTLEQETEVSNKKGSSKKPEKSSRKKKSKRYISDEDSDSECLEPTGKKKLKTGRKHTASDDVNPKFPKVRWTDEQKRLTKNYFKKNIKIKKPPTESEIEIFRENYKVLMENKDWKKIKVFVFNAYSKK